MDEETGTSVAERLLDLLECLSTAPLTVREISEKSGIPISTVHRLIRPLLSRKYLLRQGRGRYGLGLASLELSSRADFDAIIASATRPIIANLARNCRRTVHLGVFRNNLVRYLVRIEAGYSRPPSQEMTELEAYCTAIGKVLLAQLSPEQLDEYLAPGISFHGDYHLAARFPENGVRRGSQSGLGNRPGRNVSRTALPRCTDT